MTHDHEQKAATPCQHCESHPDAKQIDPVCGMTVTPDTRKTADYNGQTYFFCGQGCLAKFRANPAQYVQPHAGVAPAAPTAAETAPKGMIYTCPMHPEVRQVGPGTCPKCGMALEPLLATADADTSEYDDMRRRLLVSLVLTIPIVVITMSELISSIDLPHRMGMTLSNWLQAMLATPVVLWGGAPFFVRAWASFKTWNLNMFSLIGLGTTAAYLFSVVALLFPTVLPAAFKMNDAAPLYFEAAAFIVTLVLLGQVLELRARSQTNSAIKALLALAPNTAVRVSADGKEEEVHIDQIAVVQPSAGQLKVRPRCTALLQQRDSTTLPFFAMPPRSLPTHLKETSRWKLSNTLTPSPAKVCRDRLARIKYRSAI